LEYISDLRAFLKVVEKRNFSSAAAVLGMSQSAVSKRISRLEESLGVPLLKRSTRHLSLTDAGEKFHIHAQYIVAELDDARKSALAAHASIGGRLNVHSTLGIGQSLMAPAIAEFILEYPDVSVDLMLSPNNTINLIQQDLDVTIRLSNVQETLLHNTSVDHAALGDVRYLVCGAPDYFARAGVPATPQELARHNCLILSAQTSSKTWEFRGPDGRQTVRVSGSYSSNSGTALYDAMLRGAGLARMLEHAVANDLRDGRLRALFAGLSPPAQFVAYYPRAAIIPRRTKLFLDFLRDYLAKRLVPARQE